MMRRALRVVRNEQVVGAVTLDDEGTVGFEGGAVDVLRPLTRRLTNEQLRGLITDGWSNGYLYLAPAAEE